MEIFTAVVQEMMTAGINVNTVGKKIQETDMNTNDDMATLQNICTDCENEKPVKKMRLVMITGEPSFKMLIRRDVKELLINMDDEINA